MDFPIKSMPPKAQDAITAQSGLGNYRIEAVASSALAIMSLAAQGFYNVKDPAQTDRYYPTSQFFMVLMQSGDAKSSVYENLIKGVVKWRAEQSEVYKDELVAYNFDKQAHDKVYKDALKTDPQAAKEIARREPTHPLHRHILLSKTTTNGLFKSLETGWPSQGLFSDEAGSLLAGHSLRAENSPAEFSSALTSLWDKGAVDRTTAEVSQYLFDKRLSALLMVQPEVSREFLQNKILAEQGIHARINIVQSPKWQPVVYDFSDPSEQDRKRRLARRVEAFSDRIYDILSQRRPDQPENLTWEHDATTLGVSIYKECVGKRDDYEDNYWKRLWEHTCRMAGVLAVFEGDDFISVSVLKSAWEIVQFYAHQWATLELDVGSAAHRTLQPLKDKVFKFVKANPLGVSLTEINRQPLRGIDGSIKEKVLADLLSEEYIEIEEIVTKGRPKQLYKVKS